MKNIYFSPLVNFLSEAVVSSYEETMVSKKALLNLHEKWKEQVRPRKGSAASALLDKILERPIFTAQQAIKRLQLSKPAVYHAIDQLIQAGVIRERTGSERFRVFATEEVVEILSRDYGEDIEVALRRAKTLLKQVPT